jgi:antitoxin component YwqK of YwqJK toxin-antitoxin module
MKRYLFLLLFFLSCKGFSQAGSFIIGVKGDTLNKIDRKDLKQGKWVIRLDEVRGEPGHEEEGEYKNNRKEGTWRIYSLQGDLTGLEYYKWGNKDGNCQYFNASGSLVREESWRALNPDKLYDTLEIEDIDHLNEYKTVIVKNEGVAIRHGQWKFYDPSTGMINKIQTYTMGKLENPKSDTGSDSTKNLTRTMVKPKEVQDYEKKNSGKKKIKVRDGATN